MKNRSLIVICVVLLILVFSLFQNEVKDFFYCLSAPVQKVFWNTGKKISNVGEFIFYFKNLEKELEDLRFKSQQQLSDNVQLQYIKKENETLRQALDIGLEKDFQMVLAEVFSKDISQDFILINRGEDSGISQGQAVITSQKILCGSVSEVHENFSKVMLLTSKESSFDAQVLNREAAGVAKGKGKFQLYLTLVPREKEIKQGDIVTTRALGGIFPKGLLVGELKEIQKSDLKPFQEAEISPLFKLKEIETLFVIQ